MLRSRRLHRFVLPTIISATLLTGCVTAPEGEPFPAPPSRDLFEVLGLDVGPEAAALDAALDERIDALADEATSFAEQVDAELARAIRDSVPDGASGATPTASTTMPAATGTPGVDLPIVTERGTTTTGTTGAQPTVITDSRTSTIRDQREVTVHEQVGTTGEPDAGRGSIESLTTTTTTVPCARPGEPAGEFEIVLTRRILANGAMVHVEITTSGTVVPQEDGTIALRDTRVVMSGEGVGADGATSPGLEFTVDAEITGWDGRGDLSETRGTWTATTPPDVAEKDAVALAGAQLDAFRGVASDIADRAEHLRESEGLCVRIVVDTRGETTLADSDQARFDARVIDPATGEEIADAVIAAAADRGSISPTTATGHGSFTYTASGDPDYRVHLSTETPRGGHRATVRYGAPGWQFDGVTYGYTLVGGDIAVEITWRGRVCGAFTEPWQLDWQIRSAYGSPAVTGTQAPTEASAVTRGDRAILVYEEVPSPRDGEPPFRLWIDDENHGKAPAQQRVEIHPEPLDGPCTEA